MALTCPLQSCSRIHLAALSEPSAKTRQQHYLLYSKKASAQLVSCMHQPESQGIPPLNKRSSILGRALRTSNDQQPRNEYPQPGQVRQAPAAKLTLDRETQTEKSGGEQEEPKLPPGSLGLPIIGETLDLIQSQNPENPDAFSAPRQAKYGKIYKSNALGRNFITVSGPEAAAQILTNEKLYATEWPRSFKPLIGEHALSMTNGPKHKYLRALVANPLSLENLKTYVPLIEKAVLALLDSWQDNTVLGAHQEMRRLTFNVISELIFGAKPGPQTERLSGHFDVWVQGLAVLIPINLSFTKFGTAMKARRAILNEVAKIVSERRGVLDSGEPVPNDILTRLLTEKDAEGRQLTEEELSDNLLNLLFAGHDTSASSLSIIIHSLGSRPDVQQKLRDEHARVQSGKAVGEPLTWQDVRHMAYTDQVISEGLRLRPIVGNAFKVATEDTTLYGYRVPKGWSVNLDYRAVMCRDSYFPEADQFRPERFDEKPKPYTFLPFGSGERQCPGSALARLEMTVFLYHFLTLWDFELANPSEETVFSPMGRPKEGLPLRLRRRVHT